MILRRALFLRLAVLVALLTVIVAGSLALFAISHHRQEMKGVGLDRVHVLGDDIRSELLWDDRVAIRRSPAGAVLADQAACCAWVEVAGRPLAWTFADGVPADLLNRPRDGQALPGVWELGTKDGEVLGDVAAPVPGSDGPIHRGVRRDVVDRQNRPLVLAIFAIATAALSSGVVIAFAFARRAVREVDPLAGAIRAGAAFILGRRS